MNTTDAYAALRRLGLPVLATGEVVALLQVSPSRASHILRDLRRSGLIRNLKHGLWLIDPETDPAAIAPYLTSPYPCYVSLYSAMRQHEMIEQIPRQTQVVSIERTRTVTTSQGRFEIHHIHAALFDGYRGDPAAGYLATAEKALFDTVYLRAAQRKKLALPELELPETFNADELRVWIDRIGPGWLRTLTRTGLERALSGASIAA